MTVWIVLGCILLALVLLAQVRVGAAVEFSGEGLAVKARLGLFRLTVFPWKHKRKPKGKKGEQGPPAAPPEKEPAPKQGGRLDGLKRFLPLVADAAGRLKRKVRVDKLYLDFMAAAEDPAAAALSFGGANAAIGMIWPLLENNFNIKDRRIRTMVDFNAKAPTVWLYAAASLTLGQGVALAARLAAGALKIMSGLKAEKRQKEAV